MTSEQAKRYKDMSDMDRDRFDLQRKIIKQGNKNGQLGGLGKGQTLFGECTCENKQVGELPIISQLVDNEDKSQSDRQPNKEHANQIWSNLNFTDDDNTVKANLNVDQKSEESAEPISGQDSLAINLNEAKSKPTIVTQ